MSTIKDYSIVEYFAEHEGYRCGYCKSTDTNYSHGLWAHKLTVKDYQDLIDRGWRRSGRYCYKPTMHVTCCPMYTIKCAALDIKLTKSQKKVLKRFHRYLSHGDTKTVDDSMSVGGSSRASESSDYPLGMDIADLHKKALRAEQNLENTKVLSVDPSLSGRIVCELSNAEATTSSVDTPKDVLTCTSAQLSIPDGEGEPLQDKKDNCKTQVNMKEALPTAIPPEEVSSGSETRKISRSGTGPDVNRPPCKKAKLIRLERKHEKLLKQGYSEEEAEALMKQGKNQQQEAKSLEDFLNEPLPANSAHKLEIRLVRSSPPSHEFEQTSEQAYEVYRKYQMAIHGDPPEKCTQRHYVRFLVNSPLQLVLLKVGSPEFFRSLGHSQKLFAKYQMAIHNEPPEECNLQTFYGFLVDSPLEPWHPRDGPPQGYGSFHQQYWMDGRLIAVGVIDILPRCVSSVYFYYDPDLSQLSLGTYASLREISLTRSLHGHAPVLQYYYMGFYIHTCPKMRYKASYNPSFLLCPETYTWHPIAECKARLDQNKYCRFNTDPSAQDKDGEVNVNEVLVLFRQSAVTYCIYVAMKSNWEDEEEVTQYAKLVGMKCARRMLLVRT